MGDPTVREWLEDAAVYLRQCCIPDSEQAQVVLNHSAGPARDELKCHGDIVRKDLTALNCIMPHNVGEVETV